MNGLAGNGWFGPLDKIFVPKWKWQEKAQTGNWTTVHDVIDSSGNPSPGSGSAILVNSG